MGAIADREDCPLIAALFIFDLGDADYHAGQMASGEDGADPKMFALFQRIEARINAGGYTHRAEDDLTHDVPVVQSYLAGSGHEVWALDPAIVLPALEASRDVSKALSDAEEAAAQDIYASMKAAVGDGETAVKVRAVAYSTKVDDRILELAAADRPRRRWTVGAVLWLTVPWVVFFLLFGHDIRRILFGT